MLNKNLTVFMRYFLTIALLSISSLLTAQGVQSKRTAIQHITGESFVCYYTMFDGVPFYNGDHFTGSITMKSGETYNNLQLFYDTYKDNVIYLNDITNNLIIVDRNSIDCFTMTDKNGKTELFKSIDDKTLNDFKGRFLAIVLDDSISILKKCEAKEEVYSTGSQNKNKTSAFNHKITLYAWNKQDYYNVPRIRKHLYKQYPEHKNEIRKFVIHNHIRMKKEDDVRLLYQEINQLIKEK